MTHRTLNTIVLCAILGGLRCGAQALYCPDTIDVHQQIAEAPAGWTIGTDATPHRLAAVTFFDGPPSDMASLVYDSSVQIRGKQVATWRFTPNAERNIWLSCSYAGTSVLLQRSLPAATQSCSVTYNPRMRVAGMQTIEKITCK